MLLTRCGRLSHRLLNCRAITSIASNDATNLRNIALVAHIDSGKTTLTEAILLKSSYLSSRGSVDTGSTTTDFLPAERERGITIQSASIPVQWKKWTYNLIDTPGHADFGMEVESASRVVDGAVVLIDAVEGVESQTKGVWRQLDRYGVATRLVFLNKLDRPGASFRASMVSLLAHRLHPHPTALCLPVASFDPSHYSQAEPGIQGLVDLVTWKLWRWDDEGKGTSEPLPRTAEEFSASNLFPPSHPIIPHLLPARTELLDNLAMHSEELMESLVASPSASDGYLDISTPDIIRHLRQATLRNQILPVLCGSAMKNVGVDLVLDYVGELLASPVDIPHETQGKNPYLSALAWKVTWDSKKGWMTFVRVYSGRLTKQSVILNATNNQRERVSKLLLLYANEAQEVDELPFGSVGVILGLKHTRTGDTLVSPGSPSKRSTLPDITPPPAVISASVIPQTHADLEPVQNALQSLVRTDPSVRVEVQEGQLLVHGLGALHLEIVEGRLRDEWKAQFEFGRRRVSYREGLGPGAPPSADFNLWKTDVGGGKPVTVQIYFDVRPLQEGESGDPIWDGNLILTDTGEPMPSPESMETTPHAYISRGIASALSNSPNTSLAMTHLRVQVKGFSTTPPSVVQPHVLTGASAAILRNIIQEAGMGPVLEPYVLVKVYINEHNLGKVVKDLTEHGGTVLDLGDGGASSASDDVDGYPEDGVYIPPVWLSPSANDAALAATRGGARHVQTRRSIKALAPLSQMLDYSNRLRSVSGGHGQFEMSNAGFREVSQVRQVEIMKEIGRA